MSYTNQCFLVEVAISTSCSMHTQVLISILRWKFDWNSLSLYIYFNNCTNLQKSLILWFMLDLWPLKYLCANTSPYCFLHNRNKQYLHKLRVLVKTPWVHVGTSSSGHWMTAYWMFKLIKSCTLWCMVDLWPIHSSLCQHEPKLISSMQATIIR